MTLEEKHSKRNKVETIENEGIEGTVVIDNEHIGRQFFQHFQRLFVYKSVNMEDFRQIFLPQLSTEKRDSLDRPITEEEVMKAIEDLNPEPGGRGSEVTADLLMDEADLEEATPQANARETQPSTSPSFTEGERDKQQVAVASKDQHEPAKGVDTAPAGRDSPRDMQPPVSVTESADK
ncbi:hypothetical protein HPB50_013770 [Hyalomma asiaticum]|uniref:Uncharacterized protein n=1 Tax=Hyalomma asiaticum TaxID=266040 RepID=A0ACB7TMB9_HYAAI|nr:hypothetical protein HPB50_013770 [Hyalomma asiaticum]